MKERGLIGPVDPMPRAINIIIALIWLTATSLASVAQPADDLRAGIDALGKGSFSQISSQVEALSRTGDARLVPTLEALASGQLQFRKADGVVFITVEKAGSLILIDTLSGKEAGKADPSDLERVKVNNNLRRAVRTAIGGLTLHSSDRSTRLQAAELAFSSPGEEALELIEPVLRDERDPKIRTVLEQAKAAALLKSPNSSVAEKRVAVRTIVARGDQKALSVLSAAQGSSDGELRSELDNAVAGLLAKQSLWNIAQNVWYGLSLGSVLLLAAIGLAITFGVMGVINMAHGEMVMLGAYSTFVVQEIIRSHYPFLFDWSLMIALPVAFVVAGAVGLIMERTVICFLYGRTLETLLATWGVSLILQQGIRSIFGPTNREVGSPGWLSGGFELGGMNITYNRFWIIVFALSVFLVLLFVLKRTRFGLQMRAVTQNRRMAASMGIRTPSVDAFTFALGSGIAGMAGVALSQIDNVSPNLGQGYIIDCFMVVVFGGVGNLWGTLVGAFSLGVINKLLEPYAGAVLGKIALLVFIILFIQKRPRGLFALRGRAIET